MSLLESDEEETADTLIGKFYKKEFFGHTHAVLKVAQKNSRMLKEAERLRKRLDHLCITKLHHSYLEEKSSTRCFVLEPLEIADGTIATVAELRTDSLRECYIWRSLRMLSSALTYLHQQHPTTPPVLAYDLSPHTVIEVYKTEELKKAGLYTWKLLLLGSNTEQSLDLSEVLFSFVSSQLITLF